MKLTRILRAMACVFFLVPFLTSCVRQEDPGPLQNDERDYPILEFDRLDMGDAFVISVQQSPIYSVRIKGDRRNLDDLNVVKVGSTLKVGFNDSHGHEHTTYVTISMPTLAGASLSGATNSTITGFRGIDNIELTLSGASISQLNIESKTSTVNLSGASKLTLSGKSDVLLAKASGASELQAYAMEAGAVDADASGASKVSVYALQSLKALASGASFIYYRGHPSVNSSVNGASSIEPD